MEDRRQPDVTETIRWKVDYETWLANQTAKDQEIIRLLATGETLSNTARKVGLTHSTICQYRKRYANSWDNFIGDTHEPA